MDLRSFKLHLVDRHARVVFADARGAAPADLDGDRFARALALAQGLVDAVAAKAGAPVRAVSVDAEARVIRASLEQRGGEVEGRGSRVETEEAVESRESRTEETKNFAGPAEPPSGRFRLDPRPSTLDLGDPDDAKIALRLSGPDYDALTPLIATAARALADEARPRREPVVAPAPSEAQFWEGLYRDHRDGWDLGRAAPPLLRWFGAHPQRGKRALVVGCGRGHEARALARAGAQVIGVDFAAEAIAEARAIADKEGVAIDFRRRDLFALTADPERYDLVVEHTCFCAIDPARRGEYVQTVAGVLAPGGEFVGLFWAHGRAGGPPFSVDDAELRALFGAAFTVEHWEIPPDSVALRMGQERLLQLRKR